MKKIILSILLALAMCLSLSVPAFAIVSVDGEPKGSGEVTHNGDAKYVSADTNGDKLTVNGNVKDNGNGNAIDATGGATVTVNGNVDESNNGNAIRATGSDTTVTVNGNITEEDTGSAINVSEATIIVIGNVEEKGAGNGISAVNGATVKVGGNVTDGVETAGASNAVASGFGATVIVEGLVTGDLNANSQYDSGTIYIGQLDGDIKNDADLSKIHYLIGTAAESPFTLNDVTLESDIVADGTIDGVNVNGYRYTTTAKQNDLSGHYITLTPAAGKILTVEGLESAGTSVTCDSFPNGSVQLTFLDEFKGGLQNLVLILTDKHSHNPAKVNGQAATETAAGFKSYYKCDCGKFFEDAEGKVEITDLHAWKAKGGNGYLPKLRKASDPIIIGGNDTNTSKQETNLDTGAPALDMAAGTMLLAGVALIALNKKRK